MNFINEFTAVCFKLGSKDKYVSLNWMQNLLHIYCGLIKLGGNIIHPVLVYIIAPVLHLHTNWI